LSATLSKPLKPRLRTRNCSGPVSTAIASVASLTCTELGSGVRRTPAPNSKVAAVPAVARSTSSHRTDPSAYRPVTTTCAGSSVPAASSRRTVAADCRAPGGKGTPQVTGMAGAASRIWSGTVVAVAAEVSSRMASSRMGGSGVAG